MYDTYVHTQTYTQTGWCCRETRRKNTHTLSLRGRKTSGFGWSNVSATLRYLSLCESAHGEQLAGAGGGEHALPLV
jgi:hypothetical protein